MPWNSTFPLGSVSVKNNRAIGQQNTTYTEITMGNSIVGTNTNTTRDHFWNVGSNEDGRHRFINSPAFTVGGLAADPVIGTGMDGVLYLKSDGLSSARIQGFYRNAQGIYQYLPAFITGTVNISGGGAGDWKTLSAVPSGSYGEIFMYKNSSKSECQSGIFSTSNNSVRAYSHRLKQTDSSNNYFLELRDDISGSLNIQARRGDSGSGYDGTWTYIITYRAQ